jgi:hypothetical protein
LLRALLLSSKIKKCTITHINIERKWKGDEIFIHCVKEKERKIRNKCIFSLITPFRSSSLSSQFTELSNALYCVVIIFIMFFLSLSLSLSLFLHSVFLEKDFSHFQHCKMLISHLVDYTTARQRKYHSFTAYSKYIKHLLTPFITCSEIVNAL